MKKTVLYMVLFILLAVFLVGCSSKNKELQNLDIKSIEILFDYDEKSTSYDPNHYSLSVVKSNNTSIKDHCVFTYYVDRTAVWSEDPDGTKRMHTVNARYETVEYDISVFEEILSSITKNPSIYAGPASDSNKQLVYKTLPYLIMLKGLDNRGVTKTVYIDEVSNMTKLLERIEKLKNTDTSESNSSMTYSADQPSSAIVYWSEFGHVYHTYTDCEALNQNEALSAGTVDQAVAANRTRLCKLCANRHN